jgi:hypothetical protein
MFRVSALDLGMNRGEGITEMARSPRSDKQILPLITLIALIFTDQKGKTLPLINSDGCGSGELSGGSQNSRGRLFHTSIAEVDAKLG